jgi:hypothetical protein
MLHTSLVQRSHNVVTNLHVPADQLRATRLSMRRDIAWQSLHRSMAAGNWPAAAAWEERLVVSEHELAMLHLEG